MYPEGEHLHWSVSPPQALTGITHQEEIWVGNQPSLRIRDYFFSFNTNLTIQKIGKVSANMFICIFDN